MYSVYQHRQGISNINGIFFHISNLKFALYKAMSKAEAKRVR